MRGVIAVAIIAVGCYHPTAVSGVPCTETGVCPSGQHCDLAMVPPTCEPGDAGMPIDAAVGCTTSSTCPNAAPICDPASMTCRGCRADIECPGGNGVCVENEGRCFQNSEAIWISPAGMDTNPCTDTHPCATFARAFALVAPGRKIVRVGNGAYSEQLKLPNVLNGGQAITLSGEDDDPAGATFTGMAGQAGAQIECNGNAVIEGITIDSAANDGIDAFRTLLVYATRVHASGGRGIGAGPGALQVLRSEISNSGQEGVSSNGMCELRQDRITANGGGGVLAQKGPVTIVNSMIVANASNKIAGGVYLSNLNGNVPVMRFDTIAANSFSNGSPDAPGVNSDLAFTLEDSIVSGNGSAPEHELSSLVAAAFCLFPDSAQPSTSNITGAPAFTADYHITDASAARGAADPAATETIDFDGDSRPLGGARDIGADEIP